jgi:hypothetical protein
VVCACAGWDVLLTWESSAMLRERERESAA